METTMRKLITTTALAVAAISTTMALAGPANATDDCTCEQRHRRRARRVGVELVHRLVHQRRHARRPGRVR